jgi:hypothetical protein
MPSLRVFPLHERLEVTPQCPGALFDKSQTPRPPSPQDTFFSTGNQEFQGVPSSSGARSPPPGPRFDELIARSACVSFAVNYKHLIGKSLLFSGLRLFIVF